MRKYGIAWVCLFLVACTTLQESRTVRDEKLLKLTAFIQKGEKLRILAIPTARNAISNQMVLASLETGAKTTGVEGLIEALELRDGRSIGVIADHDGIVAATIRSALRHIEKNSTNATLYYVGHPDYIPELKEAAEQAGVAFRGISYP